MARAFPVSYEQLTVESAALTARCRISSAARIGHWPVILALWTGVEVRMVERLRHLVVVVPGIGGSVLVTPERAVWDGGVVHLAASLLRPSRPGRPEPVGPRAAQPARPHRRDRLDLPLRRRPAQGPPHDHRAAEAI